MNNWIFEPQPRPAIPIEGTDAMFPVRRIYCVGRNYVEHAREMGGSGRELPVFFEKPADTVTSAAEVPYPSQTENLHHEVELVVALSGGGSNLTVEQAEQVIFGYAVGVDLTRRDLQAEAKKKSAPWTTAKGFDHSAPVSPIRPVDAGGHPESSTIGLAVNGLMRQQGNTADMIWSVPEVIAELSSYFELKAGDLVFTGTPSGVAAVERGDLVGCKIEGVGTLAFTLK